MSHPCSLACKRSNDLKTATIEENLTQHDLSFEVERTKDETKGLLSVTRRGLPSLPYLCNSKATLLDGVDQKEMIKNLALFKKRFDMLMEKQLEANCHCSDGFGGRLECQDTEVGGAELAIKQR